MLFSYLLWRLIATLQELDPEYGIDDTARYKAVSGDKVAFGIQRVLKILTDLETYAVLEMPFFVVAVALLRSKLDGHRSLLDNMKRFDIHHAKCSVEDDRDVIEAQVARLYAIVEEPVIALDSLEGQMAAEALRSIPLSSPTESVIAVDSFVGERGGEGYARFLAVVDESQPRVSPMQSNSMFEYPVIAADSVVGSRKDVEGFARQTSDGLTNSQFLAPVADAVSDAGSDYSPMGVDVFAWARDIEGNICLSQPRVADAVSDLGSDYPLMGVDLLAWENDIEGKVPLSGTDEERRALMHESDRDDCLQVFNDLVRLPLRAAIVEELGFETDLPWGDCLIVYMPAVLAATAITWAARDLYAGLGFASMNQYLFVNLAQISLASFCNPLAYALLLQGMNCITPKLGAGLLRGLSCLACGVLGKVFVCALYAVICGTLESYVLTQHPMFLLGFLVSLTAALVLNWILFWGGQQ